MKSTNYHFKTPAELLSANFTANMSTKLLLQVYLCDEPSAWQLPLQNCLAEYFPNATVVGMTSYGQFAGTIVQQSGLSLQLTEFSQTHVVSQRIAITASYAEKHALVSAMLQADTKVILLYSTNLLHNHHDLLPLINQLRPDILVVGGIAVPQGDALSAYLLQQDTWHSNSTLLLALTHAQLQAKVVTKQNWFAVGKPFIINQASQFVVNTIDGVTVQALYQRYLGPLAKQHLAAASSLFPLIFDDGIHQTSAFVVKALPDGSAIFNRPMCSGQQVRLSFAEINNVLNNDYLAQQTALPAEQVMVFSCGGRVELLKDSIVQELAPLQQQAPTAGCFAFGEITTTATGLSSLHTHSMVMLFLAENNQTLQFSEAPTPEEELEDFNLSANALMRIYSNLTRALMADLTAINESLQDQSLHDHLTGIGNRSYLDNALAHESQRYRRYQEPFSILLLDIDFFKRVNDNYGHLQGDQVLKAVAACLAKEIRTSDLLGRWGGEEFLILCPNTYASAASIFAERIRQAIATLRIPTLAGNLSVTISIGVAESQPKMTIDELLQLADQRLYQAKMQGRNRVV